MHVGARASEGSTPPVKVQPPLPLVFPPAYAPPATPPRTPILDQSDL